MLSLGRYNPFAALGRLFQSEPTQTGWVLDDRRAAYALWDGYYHNTIYEPLSRGGHREQINALLGNAEAADLSGLFAPVARCVNLYSHVFAGDWGSDILIASPNPALQSGPPDDRNSAGRRITPLDQLWIWSNMAQQMQLFCRLTPLHGNSGLRIVAERPQAGTATQRARTGRVYLKVEHPRIIRDVELDARGNVKGIELEYDLSTGYGASRETVTIVERMDQDVTRTYRMDKDRLIPFDLFSQRDGGDWAEVPNELGVVPYVLAAHTPSGETWSYNAFYRAAGPIDRLNALNTHINTNIHRHVRATWLVGADGPEPVEMNLSGERILYVNTANSAHTPFMQALVADLSLADAITQSEKLAEQIENMLPELMATGGKFLSNQSSETVAELRKPAEDLLRLARANYEDAVIRAQKIALSYGVLYGLWDLGTGHGDAAAAERAYREGYEDHVFQSRPLLGGSDTATQALSAIQAKQRAALATADTVPEVAQ